MRFSRFYIAVALLVFYTVSGGVLAQPYYSSNAYPCTDGSEITTPENSPSGDKAIGVCDLDTTTHSLPYDGSKSIPFKIRSCWVWWGGNEWSKAYCTENRNYTIEVNGPTSGSYFILSGPGGDLPIEMTFSHPVDGPEILTPNTESSLFSGAPNGAQTPVGLEISLPTTMNLPAGIYSNSFYFSLYQCEGGWQEPNCKMAASQGKAELSPPLTFNIEIAILPQIRISNMQDILLSANSAGDVEDTRTFCVHTTGGAQFNLEANSQNGNGEFLLLGNSGIDSVLYQVSVRKDTPPTGPEIQLQEGNTYTANQWTGHPQDGCNSGADNNMRIRVHIPESELVDLQDSSYTDTVTLTVRPE